MKFSMIGMSLFSGLAFLFTNYKNRLAPIGKSNVPELKNANTGQTRKDIYEMLRNQAFMYLPEQPGPLSPSKNLHVYGMVMDWGMDDSTATIVSYKTGDAGLYLSTGGRLTGGERNENVTIAAREFVCLAQSYVNKAIKTEANSLPENDVIKFHFLTNKGIYTGQEELKNLEDNSSSWLELFEKGNNVLSELRLKR